MRAARSAASDALLVYEPHQGGHRPEFLLWLARGWERLGNGRRLVLAAPPDVLAQREELAQRVREQAGVVFDPLPRRSDAGSSLRNAVALDRMMPLRAAVRRHGPPHVLAMSFEHLVAGLAARIPLPGATRLSALSLRPVVPPAGGLGRASGWVRDRMLLAALRHPQLDALLSLDPSAVPLLEAQRPQVDIRSVPDPVPPGAVTRAASDVRADFGIPAGRRMLLLPGTLERRKGAVLLPASLEHLPPALASSVSVVMAGEIEPGLAAEVRGAVARASEAGVHVVLSERYIPTEDLPSVIAAADLVVLPYVHHVGSSGFQLRAAGCGVPALVQADGLMGRLAADHRLGPTLSAPTPERLAQVIADALARPDEAFDRRRAMAFAQTRTVDAFADALLGPLVDLPPPRRTAATAPHQG